MHHTKMKADIGVAKVISDLTVKGYVPCIPLSEHQPYDLVAISDSGDVFKIQVKYASLKSNGTIEVRFRSSWADRNGTHIRHYRKEDFDFYAVYCPEKDKVLYIPNDPKCPKAIRFEKAMNNQNLHVKWADDYLKLEWESSETIRCTPEMAKT
ncbi:MAG: hypothetical protein KKH77_00160 [Candidatus Omnitrophica bacterium]|nr:hypothetical protein [Candidatus Omnitrophota bacterium]